MAAPATEAARKYQQQQQQQNINQFTSEGVSKYTQ